MRNILIIVGAVSSKMITNLDSIDANQIKLQSWIKDEEQDKEGDYQLAQAIHGALTQDIVAAKPVANEQQQQDGQDAVDNCNCLLVHHRSSLPDADSGSGL